MLLLESVQLRTEILNWRDRQFEKTHNKLARELMVLFSALDSEIVKMEYKDIFLYGAEYSKLHFQPIYTAWAEREIREIVEGAEADLRKIATDKSLQFSHDSSRQAYDGSSSYGTEVTTATLACAGALVAIPTFASWSVVSAGGIAGWLGATVISWPVVIAGIAVGGTFLVISGTKWANLKENVHNSIKKNIRNSIRQQVLGNEEINSLCQRIHAHLEKVTNAILEEIPA
ncbi:MAG: hypothetical protein IPN92_12760 [Chromatiaceae bacterium]|nr:hypothetical protein [Chromatiaceae bacterium]